MPQHPLQRYVYLLAAVVLTVVVLYFGRDLILLSLISTLLAFMLMPMERGLERRLRAPRWLAALLATLVLVIGALGA